MKLKEFMKLASFDTWVIYNNKGKMIIENCNEFSNILNLHEILETAEIGGITHNSTNDCVITLV